MRCGIVAPTKLTPAEHAEIVKKVGPPRANGGPWIALDLDKVRSMRDTGFSMPQIAAYFGVSKATVRRRLIGGRAGSLLLNEIAERLREAPAR
jgi:predicted transcriptional regulator